MQTIDEVRKHCRFVGARAVAVATAAVAFASDRAGFAPRLERGCREILGSQVDPQIWNFNLACALAAQNRREEAFDALEQAVAAGFGTANRDFGPSSDVSLAPLTNDVRFAKLVAMMRADDRPDWTRPAQVAEVVGGVIHLGEDFVRYGVEDEAFMVLVKADEDCPVVYVNKHMDHPDVPDCPFVRAAYSRDAKISDVDTGAADILALGGDTLKRRDSASPFRKSVLTTSWRR